MKLALVGIGKIAVDQHVPAIEHSEDWEFAATVSRHATLKGVESHADFDEFLVERPDVPAVSLSIPPLPRFEYAKKALRAGRHVMLEKPPSATISECLELAQMAKDEGVCLFATWHSRKAAMVDDARDWLRDKSIQAMKVAWKEDVRRWHPGQEWIWKAGGLGVFDPGINALSIVTKILPAPMHLRASELFFPSNCETPIAAKLKFTYENDAALDAEFDWRQTGDQIWSIEVSTTKGTLRLTDGGANLFIDDVAQNAKETGLSGEYPRLYAHFKTLIDQGASETDFAPLVHVADAFMMGKRRIVEPFSWTENS